MSAAPVATFVFTGTRAPAGRTARRQTTSGTLLVSIDRVLESSAAMTAFSGQQVVVEMPRGTRVPVGRPTVFHTVPIRFGDLVTVRAISVEAASQSTTGVDRPSGAAEAESAELRQRLAAADVVVSGRVRAITVPGRPPSASGRGRSAGAPKRAPITEHAPNWLEAVVDVDAVQKGRKALRRIVVRFPASTDVSWYAAPKLEVGQSGVFLLRKADAPEGVESAGQRREVFTALHPADVQQTNQALRVKALLEPSSQARRKGRP